MKGFVVTVVACILMLGLAVIAFISAKGTALQGGLPPSASKEISAMSLLTDTLATATTADTEGVPLYPGAQAKWVNCLEGWPGRCVYSLRTDQAVDKTVSFYKQALLAKGWTLAEESGGDGAYGMQFVWTNSDGGVPARRFLQVTMDAARGTTGSDLILDFERWPDPNKVPLYQGSKLMDTKWETDPTYGALERITTYITSGTQDEVEAYYKAVMIQEGWQTSKYDTRPGLSFLYSRGIEVTNTNSAVRIVVQPLDGNQTKVELHVSGVEVVR
jgi:hypothetical protein